MKPTEANPPELTSHPAPPDPAHLARLAARRDALSAELARWLPAGARFVWEIGCGHGHFLTAYAAAHRDELCVGVDTELDRIRRAIRKQERAQLPNLHFLRTEARLFLETLPADATLAAVFILFPDPWPKRRHHKHRLLQEEFFSALAVRAGQGTPFYFRTDHAEYFLEVETLLRAHPDWRLAPDEPWPFEEATVFQQKAPAHHSLVALRR
jgi:tRNA (guanine-N7-)-methyltransferase